MRGLMQLADYLAGTSLDLLLRYWVSVRTPGLVPRRDRLDPTEMPASILPWLSLYVVSGPQRGLCRLSGTGVNGVIGCDPTGRNMHEVLPAAVNRGWLPASDLCSASGLPVGTIGRVATPGREWQRIRYLMTPFMAGDGTLQVLAMMARDTGTAPLAHEPLLVPVTEADLAAFAGA
jgi:hypothetical protein